MAERNITNIFKMPVHPAADIFPMLDEDELNELAADIKQNGLIHPLVVKDGVLIDGRNRREACRIADIIPMTVELDGQDPEAYILSSNIARRHMNASQRAMAVATIYPEPEKGGRGKNSVLSTQFNKNQISRARTVIEWTPDVASEVLAGVKPLNEAYKDALKRKANSDGLPERLKRLRTIAPDLADLVKEERMKLIEAEAAADARIAEEERRRKTFWDLLSRTENVLEWTSTAKDIERGSNYIKEFSDECPIKNPKRTFAAWARQLQKLSEEL